MQVTCHLPTSYWVRWVWFWRWVMINDGSEPSCYSLALITVGCVPYAWRFLDSKNHHHHTHQYNISPWIFHIAKPSQTKLIFYFRHWAGCVLLDLSLPDPLLLTPTPFPSRSITTRSHTNPLPVQSSTRPIHYHSTPKPVQYKTSPLPLHSHSTPVPDRSHSTPLPIQSRSTPLPYQSITTPSHSTPLPLQYQTELSWRQTTQFSASSSGMDSIMQIVPILRNLVTAHLPYYVHPCTDIAFCYFLNISISIPYPLIFHYKN